MTFPHGPFQDETIAKDEKISEDVKEVCLAIWSDYIKYTERFQGKDIREPLVVHQKFHRQPCVYCCITFFTVLYLEVAYTS